MERNSGRPVNRSVKKRTEEQEGFHKLYKIENDAVGRKVCFCLADATCVQKSISFRRKDKLEKHLRDAHQKDVHILDDHLNRSSKSNSYDQQRTIERFYDAERKWVLARKKYAKCCRLKAIEAYQALPQNIINIEEGTFIEAYVEKKLSLYDKKKDEKMGQIVARIEKGYENNMHPRKKSRTTDEERNSQCEAKENQVSESSGVKKNRRKRPKGPIDKDRQGKRHKDAKQTKERTNVVHGNGSDNKFGSRENSMDNVNQEIEAVDNYGSHNKVGASENSVDNVKDSTDLCGDKNASMDGVVDKTDGKDVNSSDMQAEEKDASVDGKEDKYEAVDVNDSNMQAEDKDASMDGKEDIYEAVDVNDSNMQAEDKDASVDGLVDRTETVNTTRQRRLNQVVFTSDVHPCDKQRRVTTRSVTRNREVKSHSRISISSGDDDAPALGKIEVTHGSMLKSATRKTTVINRFQLCAKRINICCMFGDSDLNEIAKKGEMANTHIMEFFYC